MCRIDNDFNGLVLSHQRGDTWGHENRRISSDFDIITKPTGPAQMRNRAAGNPPAR